jgi:hypothetical protein
VKATGGAKLVTLRQLWNDSDIIWQLRTLMLPKWKFRGGGSVTVLLMTFGGLKRQLNLHQQPGGFRQVKRAGNWRKKGGCRQGSLMGTGGRKVDADREAYWELDEKGWMQTRKLNGNWRKKGGCRHVRGGGSG